MLNIMETFPLGQKDWGFGSTKALHAMIEAKKSWRTRSCEISLATRGNKKLPVATLLSKEWQRKRAK